MKSIATLLILMLSFNLYAQDRRQVKQQIQDLSLRIERDAPYSDADLQDLTDARNLLRDALALVNNRGGGNSDVYKECITYAYDRYKRQYNNSDALLRAQSKCRSVADIDVLKFLFEKHYRSMNNGDAMDKATSEATRQVKDRLELIEFAYDKHYRNMNPSNAASKAVQNASIQTRSRGTLACYQQYYKVHYRTNSPSVAMDLTARTCSQM